MAFATLPMAVGSMLLILRTPVMLGLSDKVTTLPLLGSLGPLEVEALDGGIKRHCSAGPT